MSYVAALNQSYQFTGNGILFEDGIEYTIHEAVAIARGDCTDEDIRAIHAVKRIFDGMIIAYNDGMIVRKRDLEDIRLSAARDIRDAAYNASESMVFPDLSDIARRFDPAIYRDGES